MSIAVRDDPRFAGQVLRYHTWPHIRKQSVAEHSWQLCRLILIIAPQYADRLLPYAVLHDTPEITTGDLPFPVKKNNPDLARIIDRIEDESSELMSRVWSIPRLEKLTPDFKWIFKIIEFIEMWEWGLEEILFGNKFADLVAKRCLKATADLLEEKRDMDIVRSAAQYIMTRERAWNVS